MAIRGRKPTPTALKMLEGNPGKRPINKHEPIPPSGAVECPSWLLPEAKMAWDRIAPMLMSMGLLTVLDVSALAGYCQSYAQWLEARENVTRNGVQIRNEAGKLQQNPFLNIESKSLSIMKSFAREFGFRNEMFLQIIADGESVSGGHVQ